MLTRLETPHQREQRIIAWDCEWYPDTYQLRMIGVFDGQRYRHYKSVGDFCENEFIPENHGAWYYAHFGGGADIQFIFDYMIAKCPTWSVNAIFTASSAVMVRIRKGNLEWMLIDSYYTIRVPLREIGKRLGMEKGDVSFYAEDHLLRIYNEQDCRILHKGMSDFQNIILDLGSEISVTLASTAMRLFRRQYLPKRGIRTSQAINDKVRLAYAGGNTQNHAFGPRRGKSFDICSSYPNSMRKPLPGDFYRESAKLPRDSTKLYIAQVLIDVPTWMHNPPVPHVAQGSLFFDVGPRVAWLCKPELEYAVSLGCNILEVYSVYQFWPQYYLKGFADDLYARRLKYQKEDKLAGKGPGFWQLVMKLLLNSGYGKFGEDNLKQQLLINPPREEFIEMKRRVLDAQMRIEDPRRRPASEIQYQVPMGYLPTALLDPIRPGVFLFEEYNTIHHAHVAIAATVTSYSRVDLHRFMAQVETQNNDTDSIFTEQELPTGKELGELKVEKEYDLALFHAPKLYAALLSDKKLDEKRWNRPIHELVDMGLIEDNGQLVFPFGKMMVAAKGFQRLNYRQFLLLRPGGAILSERMLRVKELYRLMKTNPQSRWVEKRVLARVCPKRRPLPRYLPFRYGGRMPVIPIARAYWALGMLRRDGHSVPWSVHELQEPPEDAEGIERIPLWKRLLIADGLWDPERDMGRFHEENVWDHMLWDFFATLERLKPGDYQTIAAQSPPDVKRPEPAIDPIRNHRRGVFRRCRKWDRTIEMFIRAQERINYDDRDRFKTELDAMYTESKFLTVRKSGEDE